MSDHTSVTPDRALQQRVNQAMEATLRAIERSRETWARAVETRLWAQEVQARLQARRLGKDRPSSGWL